MNIIKLIDKVPCRLVIAVMIFTASCVNYMMRVNLSINIVLMVPSTNLTQSVTFDKCHWWHDKEINIQLVPPVAQNCQWQDVTRSKRGLLDQGCLNWTAYEKAQVLGSFYWGYLIGLLITGPFIQLLGPKLFMVLTALLSSVLTFLSPAAAKHSYVSMVVLRVILGFVCGTTYPSCHSLVSKWAVATEKGRFLGMLIGGAIGTFFAWTLGGVIIEAFGWEWGFHVFGFISFFTILFLWYFIYDNPEKHPRISAQELQFIQRGMRATDDLEVKKIPPYAKMLMSVPCWSLAILNFGTGWGIYFVITAAPNYLASALGYNTSSTGLLSGLIYLIRSLCALGFGSLGDFILKKKLLSTKVLRKVGGILSHIVPGCIVTCMAIPGYQPSFYVLLIIVAMGVNGFVTVSNAANPHDLTKKYVSTLTGLSAAFTTLAGTVSPFVTAYFIKDDETNEELWRPVFYTGGLVYIVTGLQFVLFGSTDIQPWEESTSSNQKKIPTDENVVR